MPAARYNRKPKRTSMAMVSLTGKPAPSWTPAPELSALANRCYIACLSPYARPDLIRVYRNSGTAAMGRCYIDQRIITIDRALQGPLQTLAHEIAHLKYRSHGIMHERLTDQLYAWIGSNINESEDKY